jgi:Serine kinase of the HPr protein, regulates carbohydrate metabolism
MFHYKAFGLSIHSEIEVEEFIPYESESADLVINAGAIPEDFTGKGTSTPNRRININRYYLHIPQVSEYYAENGNHIIVNPYHHVNPEEIKLYLLGSCMGAILFQRRTLPIHGSSIKIDDSSIILTGISGAGKSTITGALLKRGFKILTDDVAAINDQDHNISVVPSYPCQKLWADALDRNGLYTEKKDLKRISNDLKKYSVKNISFFFNEPVALKYMFEIVPSETAELTISELKSIEKLEAVMKNTYRIRMPYLMGLSEWHFIKCTKFAERVKIFRIIRPVNEHLENQIAEIILNKIM